MWRTTCIIWWKKNHVLWNWRQLPILQEMGPISRIRPRLGGFQYYWILNLYFLFYKLFEEICLSCLRITLLIVTPGHVCMVLFARRVGHSLCRRTYNDCLCQAQEVETTGAWKFKYGIKLWLLNWWDIATSILNTRVDWLFHRVPRKSTLATPHGNSTFEVI